MVITKKEEEKLLLILRDCTDVTKINEQFTVDEIDFVVNLFLKQPASTFLIDVPGDVAIIADLHGDQMQLIRLLNDHLFRTEPFQYIRRDVSMIFLGDYVDRGFEGIRVMMTVLTLHLLYPERFHPLRGNHEFAKTNSKWGFRDECQLHHGKVGGDGVWNLFNMAFGKFPLCGVADDKIFCVHGGISADMAQLDEYRKMPVPCEKKLMGLIVDLTWSDPSKEVPAVQELEENYGPNGTRGVGKVFTERAVREFLKKHGLKLIIRAHECVMDGIAVFANRGLATLFSDPIYDGGENTASAISFSGNGEVVIRQYDPMLKKPAEKVEIKDELTSDEPTAREPKKLPRKTKKKINWKVDPIVAVLQIMFIFGVFFCIHAVGQTAVRSYNYHFNPVALKVSSGVDGFGQNTNILSRVVGSVSLSDALQTGTIDEMTLAKELFSLGNFDLDTSDLKSIPADFDKIGKTVDSECSGTEGCGIPDTFSQSVTTFDSMNVVPEEGDYVDYIQNITEMVKKNQFGMVADQLKVLKDKKAAGIQVLDYVMAAGVLTKSFQGLEESFSNVKNGLTGVLDKSFFAVHVTFLKSIESVTNDKPETNLLLKLKTDLKNLHDKLQRLKDVMTDEMIGGMNKKLGFMESIRPLSISEKKLSSGFRNGFNDVKSALIDYKNPWLVKTLNPGKNLSALPTMIKPMKSIIQKTEALQKLWKKDPIDSMLSQIRSVSSNLKTSDVLSDIVKVFAQILKASSGLKLDQKITLDFKTLIGTLEDAVKKFDSLKAAVKKFEASKTIEHLMEIKNLEKENVNDVNKFVSRMTELTTIDGMIPELNELQNALATVKMDDMTDSVNLIKDFNTKVITPFNKWKDDSGLSPLLTTIANEKFLESLQNLNPLARKLEVLKSGNADITAVNNLANNLNALTEEWKKIKPKLTQKTRGRREARQTLKISSSHSKVFGNVAFVLQELINVKKLNGSIQNILDSGSTIDSVIMSTTDSEEKKDIQNLWNPEVQKSLKNILKVSDKMHKSILKHPYINNISDLSIPFEVATEVQNTSVNIQELVKALDGKIQDQKLAGSLKAVQRLDLSFVSMKASGIEDVLNDIQEYFDEVFEVKRGECADGSCSTLGFFELYLVEFLVGLFVFALIVAVISLVICLCIKKRKNKVQPVDPNKDDVPDSGPVENTAATSTVGTGVSATKSKSNENKEPKKGTKGNKNEKKTVEVGDGLQASYGENGSVSLGPKEESKNNSPRPSRRSEKAKSKKNDEKNKKDEKKKNEAEAKKLHVKPEELTKAKKQLDAQEEDNHNIRTTNVTWTDGVKIAIRWEPHMVLRTPPADHREINKSINLAKAIENFQNRKTSIIRNPIGPKYDIFVDVPDDPSARTRTTQSSEASSIEPSSRSTGSKLKTKASTTTAAEQEASTRTAASGDTDIESQTDSIQDVPDDPSARTRTTQSSEASSIEPSSRSTNEPEASIRTAASGDIDVESQLDSTQEPSIVSIIIDAIKSPFSN